MRRLRPRASGALVLLSVALAAAATLLLRGRLERLEAAAAAPGPSVPAVVAVSDLPRGTVLHEGLLREEARPRGMLPPGVLRSAGQALGRTLGGDVARGEVLTEARLAGGGGPVAALVPEGLRAVAVESAIPAGLLRPGDRVDVLAASATGTPYAETVASEAEVLQVIAAGASLEGDERVTLVLLVPPPTAQRLAAARMRAELVIAVVPAP